MRVSQFSFSLAISFAFMVVLLPLLMSIALANNSGPFYTDLLIHELILTLVGLSILVGVIIARDLYDPLWFAQKNLRQPTIDIASLVDNFDGLCDAFKLEVRPRAVVTEDAKQPFTFGVHQGNSIVVLPKRFLYLNSAERQAIMAHELWHVHADVEAGYHQRMRKVLWVSLSLVALGAILAAVFEHDYLGWWNKKLVLGPSGPGISPTLIFDLYTLNLPWLVLLALVYPPVFFLLSRAVTVLSGYPAFLKRDYSEYIADSVASLTIGSSRAVANAARNLSIDSQDSPRRFPGDWKNIFDSRFTGGQHIPLPLRISGLFLVESLVNGTVKLAWNHKPRRSLEKMIISLVFHTRAIMFGDWFKMQKETFWRVTRFIEANNQFSLVQCAKETHSSLFDVYFAWFLLCVYSERLRILEPRYEPEKFEVEMSRI